MKLNKSIAIPLYKQLEHIIRSDLESGTMLPGQRIPTEAELGEMYGVSRVTVRKALEALSKEGCLERRSGKGTFVTEKKLHRYSTGVTGFTEMCRKQGRVPSAKMLRLEVAAPENGDAARLHLAPGENVIVLERIRYADGVPVVLESATLPQNEYKQLLREDFNKKSLRSFLHEQKGLVLKSSFNEFEIKPADSHEARCLDVQVGYPLLSITSEVCDDTGRCICRCTLISVSDKFKLIC